LRQGRCLSAGTQVSSTNKTDHHDITEILLKVALNTINPTNYRYVVDVLKYLQPDKESMRAVKSNDEYDVTFTLVNPQPDILDVQWDIEAGVCKYIILYLVAV